MSRFLRASVPQCPCGEGRPHPTGHCWPTLHLAHPAEEYDWVRVRTFDFPSTVAKELADQDGGWVFTRGVFVARWIEAHCIFTDGKWIGTRFKLMPWQRRLLVEAFATGETGRRLFRWTLVGIPKKNGKTELAAALSLFFLVADGEPAPLVLCAAASEDQADLAFGAAATMANADLNGALDFLKAQGGLITWPESPRARLVRVAAAAGTNDGKNVQAAVIDELHEWAPGKHEQMWNIITNGGVARSEPMMFQITTAGNDLDTLCGHQYEHLMDMLDGTVPPAEDPAYYGVWFQYEKPEGADDEHWKTEEAVVGCNPSYGLVMTWAFYEDQLKRKSEAVYRRYYLNRWTEAEEIWEAASLWDGLGRNAAELLTPDQPLCVAIDIGLKHDSSAVVAAQLLPDGRVANLSKIWTNPHRPGTAAEAQWRLELAEVENYLLTLFDRFRKSARRDVDDRKWMPGPAFFYDPYFFQRSAEDLRGQGLNMLDYPQTDVRMVPASQTFFELIKTGRLVHDGSPAFRKHVRSVVAKETPRGWRVGKPKGGRKRIDAAIAGSIASLEAARTQTKQRAPKVW